MVMLIRRRRGWELPESAATDEAVFLGRRRLIKAIAAGSILAPGLLRGGLALAADEPTRRPVSIRPSKTRNTRSTGR